MKYVLSILMALVVFFLIANVMMASKHLNNQQNYVYDSQMISDFHSELKNATGYLADNNPDLAYISTLLLTASNDLSVLNDSLTEQGVPNVAQVSVQLQNIATDFQNSGTVSQAQIDADENYVTKAYHILKTECYPHGTLKQSALPKAFGQLNALSQ